MVYPLEIEIVSSHRRRYQKGLLKNTRSLLKLDELYLVVPSLASRLFVSIHQEIRLHRTLIGRGNKQSQPNYKKVGSGEFYAFIQNNNYPFLHVDKTPISVHILSIMFMSSTFLYMIAKAILQHRQIFT